MTARCSRSRRAATPSPRWPPSTAPTGPTPCAAWSRTAAAISSARPMAAVPGDGTVFEVTAGSSAITTLASFNGTNGAGPHGRPDRGQQRQSLRHDLAAAAAVSDGTVFEVQAGSGTITTLASFNGTNGAYPYGGLVEDSSGNSSAPPTMAARHGDGTVFEVAGRQRHRHHARLLQRHQRGRPLRRPGRGQQRQSLRHDRRAARNGDGTVFEIQAGSGTDHSLASVQR